MVCAGIRSATGERPTAGNGDTGCVVKATVCRKRDAGVMAVGKVSLHLRDFRVRHVLCFDCEWSFQVSLISPRAHLCLRLVGLAIILVAEFGPRLWSAASASTSAPVAAAVDAR
jgi:hypothetical protein